MNIKAFDDRDAVGSSIGQITVVIVCLQHIDQHIRKSLSFISILSSGL